MTNDDSFIAISLLNHMLTCLEQMTVQSLALLLVLAACLRYC